MNIDEFDHFQSSPSNILEFTITDRPILPTQAEIILWHSWEHDFNQNGQIDISEVEGMNLNIQMYLPIWKEFILMIWIHQAHQMVAMLEDG